MPSRPTRTCPTPGCPGRWDGQTCTACARSAEQADRAAHRTRDARRRAGAAAEWYRRARKWYQSRRWARRRREHLTREPLCRQCKARGVIRAAGAVDHILPHRGDETLFWDPANWQSLCIACHNAKSAAEQAEQAGEAR